MNNFQSPVGYMINHESKLEGTQGLGYDYIMAANGLFLQAENENITARICIAHTEVRGLKETTEKVELRHGPIPAGLIIEGARWMQQTPTRERYFAILWNKDRYQIEKPIQTGQSSKVEYLTTENAAAEFHSHALHPAFFSTTDDKDEQGLRVYGVIGRLDLPNPQLLMRLGVYGYFQELEWHQVFDTIQLTTPNPTDEENEP